jgi:hypothetical protein
MRIAPLLFPLLVPAALACPPDREPAERSEEAGVSAVAFYEVGVRPRAIAVADFNGDGRPDVAVANGGDGTVTLLFGGAEGLGEARTFPAGQDPADLDAVDLDGDGAADLVIANHETTSFSVLRNDGRGAFAAAAGSPFETGARPHIHGLATGDFDGDGRADVAVESADTREVRVLSGTREGFAGAVPVGVRAMPYSRLGVGDTSRDGTLDILVPGHGDSTVVAIEGSGGALRASTWTIELDTQPWMVVAGDVDADGSDDLVVVETSGVSLWLATAGGFKEAPHSPVRVIGATEAAVGDFDGDGAADVAVAPWDGTEITLVFGRGGAVQRVAMCERAIGLAIADLNGDGKAELLATCTMENRLAVATP